MRFPTLHWSLQPTLAIAGLALGLTAGCNQNAGSSGGTCVQGQVNFCPCPGDAATSPSGTQTCLPDGTYGLCQCGDAPAETESDSGDGSTGDTAESESDSQGTTGNGPDLCGNGFPDPGECDIGPDGGEAPCPEDCQSDTDTEGDTEGDTDSGTTGVVDVCEGVPIFVGSIPDSASIWQFPGFGDGFTSGTQACLDAGFDGVCTYSQMVEANDQGDFAAVAEGTTFWVHRVVATMFDGMMIQPDTRSRCDDWRYGTNDVNDGEYATVSGGALTFTLDVDPNPNGPMDASGLDCGGLMRAIPCCNVCEG